MYLRFTNAKTGVYCGPLKMLAVEVFNKTNERGVDCDLGCWSIRVVLDAFLSPIRFGV